MILEGTDKDFSYLPIVLFHKVTTSCVLFRAQKAKALWKNVVCLCTITLISKPSCKRKLQDDDCWHPYVKLLVHGLMMKSLHSKPCTDAAAKDSHQ